MKHRCMTYQITIRTRAIDPQETRFVNNSPMRGLLEIGGIHSDKRKRGNKISKYIKACIIGLNKHTKLNK